jgi:hypothetical protein
MGYSEVEAEVNARVMMAQADTDKNGRVTAVEFVVWVRRKLMAGDSPTWEDLRTVRILESCVHADTSRCVLVQ